MPTQKEKIKVVKSRPGIKDKFIHDVEEVVDGMIKVKTPRKEYDLSVGDITISEATEKVKKEYPTFTEFEFKTITYKKTGKDGEFIKRIDPPEKIEQRWQKKKEHIRELSDNVGRLKNRITRDLKEEDEKNFLTALIISILLRIGERIGNEESANYVKTSKDDKRKRAFGVSGFKKTHVDIIGNKVHFSYIGKKGVQQDKSFSDEKIAKALKVAIKKSPTAFIFTTSEGQKIGANQVNDYLRDFNITAKGIRGYYCNRGVLEKLKDTTPEDTDKKRKKQLGIILKSVAAKVGHGPSVLRNQYLMPEVITSWIDKGEVFDIKEAGYVMKAGGKIENATRIEDTEKKYAKKKEPKAEESGFNKWFGNSKVVDKKNNPQIVYHGTSEKFNKFDIDKTTQGIIWFTSSKEDIEKGEVGAQGKGYIMELYASIQNPAGWNEYDKYGLTELESMGYDGVILPEKDGSFVGFVFDPTRLKSATNNIGTFDGSNPDIRYENGGDIKFWADKIGNKWWVVAQAKGYPISNEFEKTGIQNEHAEFYKEILGNTWGEKFDNKEDADMVAYYLSGKMSKGGIPNRYKEIGFTRVGQKKRSTRPEKKWMVLAKKGDKYKVVHGGQKGMEDFSQHHDKKRQKRFWNRMGGFDSEKSKDPFSPLYWHKRFGTWEKGGVLDDGTIKVAWVDSKTPDTMESKMFDSVDDALKYADGKSFLIFELEDSHDDYYKWSLLPYGMYDKYKTALNWADSLNMMESGGMTQYRLGGENVERYENGSNIDDFANSKIKDDHINFISSSKNPIQDAVSLPKYNDLSIREATFLNNLFSDLTKLKKTSEGEYYVDIDAVRYNRILMDLEKKGYGYIIGDSFTAEDKLFEFTHAVRMFSERKENGGKIEDIKGKLEFKKMSDNLFVVTCNTQEKLAKLFVRPNSYLDCREFKGKIFTLKEFSDWYAKEKGAFTYYQDYKGFNIPDSVIDVFLNGSFNPLSEEEKWLMDNLKSIVPKKPYYVIGYVHVHGEEETRHHELAHALYYLSGTYKNEVDHVIEKFWKEISPEALSQIQGFLTKLQYDRSIWNDEMNAYLVADKDYLIEEKAWSDEFDKYRKTLGKIFEINYYKTFGKEFENELDKRYSAGGKVPTLNSDGGYDYSGKDEKTAEHVGLITLPKKVAATNCGNCIFFNEGFCDNKAVLLPVTHRQCCSYWDTMSLSTIFPNLARADFFPDKKLKDKKYSKNENGGYDYDGEGLERAKNADLITLPKEILGTTCAIHNCKWTDKNHFCTHPKVQLPVTDRMSCSLWNNDAVVRPWGKMKETFFAKGGILVGSGSARRVYDIGSGKVKKIAYNNKGIEQNKNEVEINDGTWNILPKIFDYSPDYKWIVTENVRPATEDELWKYFKGFSFWDIEYYIWNKQDQNSRKHKLILNDPFVKELIRLKEKYNLDVDDLSNRKNYGFLDGKLKLLDYGMKQETREKLYAKGRQIPATAQKQIDEYIKEGIFIKESDRPVVGSLPMSRFNGPNADIFPNQLYVDSKGVAKWRKRIMAGERPYVLIDHVDYLDENRVKDAHHRLAAYEQLGFMEVPVIDVNGKVLNADKMASGGIVDEGYKKWKRKNVTYRGMREPLVEGKARQVDNNVYGSLGKGLYTAALSNKSMAKEYGTVYFVVNGRPKNPKKFNNLNEWEIWFYNNLVFAYSKAKGKDHPDKRDFMASTTIEDEMKKLGYDGIEIVGREIVNFVPGNDVRYFRTEDELKDYYDRMPKMDEGGNIAKPVMSECIHSIFQSSRKELTKDEMNEVLDRLDQGQFTATRIEDADKKEVGGKINKREAEAQKMAEEFVSKLSEADLASLKNTFNQVVSEYLVGHEKKLSDLESKKSNLQKEIDELYQKEKGMPFGEAKTELTDKRRQINARIASLDIEIRHQQNIVKAISNGGELVTFADKKGTEHKEIPYFVRIPTDLIAFDEETILTDKVPPYIPSIDEKVFADKGYVFDAIRIAPDQYILAANGYKERVGGEILSYGHRSAEEIHHPSVSRQGYVIVSLDQLALINDYYFTKAKATERKKAEDSNIEQEKHYDKLSETTRAMYVNQKGFYHSLPVVVKKKITQPEFEALSVSEKEKLYKPFARASVKRLTSKLEEDQMWVSFHEMYERFVNPEALPIKKDGTPIKPEEDRRGMYGIFGNKEVFAYWYEFRDMMKWKILDIGVQREMDSEVRKIALETSFGESNTNDSLKKEYGILVKMQNGTKIMPAEINQIRDAWIKVQKTFGTLSHNAAKDNLKISHTGIRLVFASRAAGVFIPDMKTIAVSNKFGNNQFEQIMAHEVAHWIDYGIGHLKGKRYACDDFESTSGIIARTFRKNMNQASDSKYINATKECFARAMEQYFAFENFGDEAMLIQMVNKVEEVRAYHSEKDYVSKEKFNATIKPLIKQFLSEQESFFKYSVEVESPGTMAKGGEIPTLEYIHVMPYHQYSVADLNSIIKHFKFPFILKKMIGEGENGRAYLTQKGTIVKVTDNKDETQISAILMLSKLPSQSKVFNVYKITDGTNNLYFIEKEKVDVLGDVLLKKAKIKKDKQWNFVNDYDKKMDYVEKDIRGEGEKGYSESKADRIERIADSMQIYYNLSEKETNEIKKTTSDYYDLLQKLISDEKTSGIKFNDVQAANIGYSKNKLVCFDCLSGIYQYGGNLAEGGIVGGNYQFKNEFGSFTSVRIMPLDENLRKSDNFFTIETSVRKKDGEDIVIQTKHRTFPIIQYEDFILDLKRRLKDKMVEGGMVFNENLSYLLKDKGQTTHIGEETGSKVANGISVYKNPSGSYRYVKYINGIPVAAIQVMSRDGIHGYVSNAYTSENNRRQGHGLDIINNIKKDFENITLSEDLSRSGRSFKEKVLSYTNMTNGGFVKLGIGDYTNIGKIEDEVGDQFQINGQWYHKRIVEPAKTTSEDKKKMEIKNVIEKLKKERGKGEIELYHGTDIDSYNKIVKSNQIGIGEGITFFTDNMDEAKQYASNKAMYRNKKSGKVIEVKMPEWAVKQNEATGEYETEFEL